MFAYFFSKEIFACSEVLIKLPVVYNKYQVQHMDVLQTKTDSVDNIGQVNVSNNSDVDNILKEVCYALVTVPKHKLKNINSEDIDEYDFWGVGDDEGLNSLIDRAFLQCDEGVLESVLRKDLRNVALIPFESLKPTYKLVNFNNKQILEDADYSLCLYYYIKYEDEDASIKANIKYSSNRNLQEILTITQTGVTAISRALAIKIENSNDNAYPARKIHDYLKSSDFTHISNEVSFTEDCVVPNSGMLFCSKPEYYETLELADIDIVELTGNHNNDYGADWNTFTIDKYEENGILFFGGGRDKTEASKILYVEDKGSIIAFLGYNIYDTYWGNSHALASFERAGANSYSDEKLASDIKIAKANADVVIVDFQFQECWCYTEGNTTCYYPISYPDQEEYFRRPIDLGADIVVGTQAHQPQIVENYNGGVIFYGLGNLWFDQTPWEGTRQGMIITHYFYNGKHIYTDVLPTYYDNEMQVFLLEDDEKEKMLDIYYQRE